VTRNSETAISDSLSAAPDVPWAAAAFDLVLSEENRPVANHSVRSWAFARLLRDHLDLVGEVDESLLLPGRSCTILACVAVRENLFASDCSCFPTPGMARSYNTSNSS
jgi:hypothetical protein